MSENNPAPEPTPAPAPAPAPAPTADPSTTADQPEWVRAAIKKANDEAASYRVQLRDAQAKLAAQQPKDLESKVAELADKLAKAEKSALVAKVSKGLPDELIPLLQGDTEEELTASAELLRKHIKGSKPADVTPPTNLRGGLNPTEDPDAFDVDKFVTNWRAGTVPRASVSRTVAL